MIKMPKTSFLLILVPLVIVIQGKIIPMVKPNIGAIENVKNGGKGVAAGSYNGFHEEEPARDINGVEGTEIVQEADQEVDQEEIPGTDSKELEPDVREQQQMLNGGHRKGGMGQQIGEEDDFGAGGSIHPRAHEAVEDARMPGVKHFRPVEETGNVGEEEAAKPSASENDQLDEENGGNGEENDEEQKEDKGPQIGRQQHQPKTGAASAVGSNGTEEEKANTQNVDAENLGQEGNNERDVDGMGGNEGEHEQQQQNGGEQQEEEEENEEEKAKFLRIYPFLGNAPAEAMAAFRALLRDQHLSKTDVEQKRREWAMEQNDEVKNGFFAWKERLDAKKQKAMKRIEKKMATFADETRQLYLEVKAIIADQAISRHQECKQIRSLVNSADKALRADFLEKVKLRLIKFCLEEEEQQTVEDSMPPGPGNAGDEKNLDDGLPLSDGSDDLEQNHPPPPQLPMGLENGGVDLQAHQQQSESMMEGNKLAARNQPMMSNGQLEETEAPMENSRAPMDEEEENGEMSAAQSNVDEKFTGENMEEDFDQKLPQKEEKEAFGKEPQGKVPMKKNAIEMA